MFQRYVLISVYISPVETYFHQRCDMEFSNAVESSVVYIQYTHAYSFNVRTLHDFLYS